MEEELKKSTLFSSTYQPLKNGRPKGSKSFSLKNSIEQVLNSEVSIKDAETGLHKKVKALDAMIISIIRKAYNEGDVKAFETILDRVYGRVPVQQQISYDPENPYGVLIQLISPEEIQKLKNTKTIDVINEDTNSDVQPDNQAI